MSVLSSGPMCGSHPQSDPAIRIQLGRILSSRQFSRSERLGHLLRFIVESALESDLASLKENVLGREVYNRGAAFDARIDPIVRTEARRLRRKLAEYYNSDGRSDPLLISVPKGAYIPLFQPQFEDRPRMAGEAIGPYTVVEKIGDGPSGTTYRVRSDVCPSQLALKVLSPDIQQNGTLLSHLDVEIRDASSFRHENVCAVRSIEHCDGQVCVISDLQEGRTLEDRLAADPPGWSECIEIFRQIICGLAAAHSRQIVHGHIKPGDILITRSKGNGNPGVTILNLGTRSLAGRTRLTSDCRASGTTAYSPRNEPADARSDVWSAGAILYELMTGSVPSAQIAYHPSSIPWRSVVPDEYRQALTALLSRCLALDPGSRFINAVQLSDAFAALKANHAAAIHCNSLITPDEHRSRTLAGVREYLRHFGNLDAKFALYVLALGLAGIAVLYATLRCV